MPGSPYLRDSPHRSPHLDCAAGDARRGSDGFTIMRTLLRATALAAVIAACDAVDPGGLCGCSPPVYGAIVTGTVTDAAGAPAASARVNIQFSAPARCGDVPSSPSAFVERIDTDASGRFADTLQTGWQGTTCWEFSASPLGPAGIESDTLPVTIRFRVSAPFDSVYVQLRLR